MIKETISRDVRTDLLYKEFSFDERTENTSLPVTCAVNSKATCIEDGSVWKFNGAETWVEQVEKVKLLAGTDIIGKVEIDQETEGSNEVVIKSAIPSGTNNIGDVDIASALPAGTNTIGAVDLASSIPAGTNNIGDVDLASSIPAGTNTIGAVNINSNSGKSSVSKTRPANTAAYAANDVIADVSVAATGVLTFDGVVTDGETVTIGTDIYEFDTDASVTGTNILVDVSAGATAADAVTALAAAITASDTVGVGGVDGAGDIVVLTADTAGAAGNEIGTTTTCANAAFASTSLTGGLTQSNMTLTDILPANGSGFILMRLKLIIELSAVPAGMGGFTAHLFSVAPVVIADNETFNIPVLNDDNHIGSVPMATPVDRGEVLVSDNYPITLQGKLAADSNDLYVILTTDNAYTPAASTVYKLVADFIGV